MLKPNEIVFNDQITLVVLTNNIEYANIFYIKMSSMFEYAVL